MKKLVDLANDVRGIGALALVLALGLALLTRSLVQARARTVEVARTTEKVRLEVDALSRTLEAERASRDVVSPRSGFGPGGIGSRWDTYLFDGPTAAQSALELTLAVDESGYHHLRYEGRPAHPIGTFPPEPVEGTEGAAAARLPVRGRYELVEWPIEVYVESDYESLLRLIARLSSSQPGFSIRDWRLEALRDERGDVIDRLSLHGELATFWLAAEG